MKKIKWVCILLTLVSSAFFGFAESAKTPAKKAALSENEKIAQEVAEGKDLKTAELALDKFGYVGPILNLAKTDAAAKEALDKIVKRLKIEADGGDKYSASLLAQIAYMRGDFDIFKKYAQVDFAKTSAKALSLFGDNPSFAAVNDVINQCSYLKSSITNGYMNGGFYAEAESMMDADENLASSCGIENMLNMYYRPISEMSDERIGKLISRINSLDKKSLTPNLHAVKYVLSKTDKKYEKTGAESLAELEKLPEIRRARIMYDTYNNFNMRDKSFAYLEKLYAFDALNSYEKTELARKWLFGNSLYRIDEIPIGLKDNPNLDKIIKIFAEAAKINEGDSYNGIFLLKIYNEIGDKKNYDLFLDKYIKGAFKQSNQWMLANIIVNLVCGDNGINKDLNKAEEILKELSNSEKGKTYSQIAQNFINNSNSIFAKNSIKDSISYNEKAMDLGSFSGMANVVDILPYEDSMGVFSKYGGNKYVIYSKGAYLAANGDWESAYKLFQKAADMDCGFAKIALFGCAIEGKFMDKNPDLAEKLFAEFSPKLKNYCGDTPLHVWSGRESLSKLFGDNSEAIKIYEKKTAQFNRGIPDSNFPKISEMKTAEGKKKLDEYFEKILVQKNNSNYMYTVLNYYSNGRFADKEKALQCAKFMFEKNADNYNSEGLAYPLSLIEGKYGVKDEKLAFELLSKKAEKVSLVKLYLAACYRKGIGVEKNLPLSAQMFSDARLHSIHGLSNKTPKAIKDGIVEIVEEVLAGENLSEKQKYNLLNTFANVYYSRNSDKQNRKKYAEILKKNAEKNPSYFYNLYQIYAKGELKDSQKAFAYLQKYADWYKTQYPRESEKGNLSMALAYFNGEGVEKNAAKAFELFKKCTAKPYSYATAEAMEAVAYCLENGIGTAPDKAEAEKIRAELKRIADFNTAPIRRSCFKALANMYAKNSGYLNYNPQMRKMWIEYAAQKYPTSENLWSLYNLYSWDRANVDHKKAFEALIAYEKAKKTAPHNFLNRKGISLYYGLGTDKNEAEGEKLLLDAYEYGNMDALESLAYLYAKNGDKANAEKFAKLLDSNAKDWNLRNEAKNYVSGYAGVVDLPHAKALLEAAAKKGDKAAAKSLEDFEKFVSENS